MSTKARRHLMRQFMQLRKSEVVGCIASPVETDVLLWKAQINGPENSIWEGGVFKLEMKFSEEYPDEPPKVKFLTKMFHPNIYENGDICVDMLQKGWVATYGVENILVSLQSLLTDPNTSSPANHEAANLYDNDRKKYENRVKEIVKSSLQDED
eukprot:TRINITY_DN51_c0_g1_i1.p1 TRINITY_DN51_c0_g1~~TRINITY_DN51_c0_g1_i1.p1  ORF type:complete len:154 (-),score=44.32 TRINITY_DN51_c0_g1_i1:168-629(-)